MDVKFKLIANGKDITDNITLKANSITLIDEANEEADELSFDITGPFKRPAFGDEIMFYLGWDVPILVGKYYVQSTERRNNMILSVSCTSVDFNGPLKEKKDSTFTGTLKQLVEKKAKEYNLKTRTDCDDIYLKGYAQSDESDLNMLNRIAEDYNLIFNIKNGTIVMLHREKDGKINPELPRYYISANNITNLTITQNSADYYKSCKAIWRDIKKNKMNEAKTGDGEPCLVIKGCYKNETEAKHKAKAALSTKKRQQTIGSSDILGSNMFAGGVIVLSDTIDEDGEYYIKRITHRIDNGWNSYVEFSK